MTDEQLFGRRLEATLVGIADSTPQPSQRLTGSALRARHQRERLRAGVAASLVALGAAAVVAVPLLLSGGAAGGPLAGSLPSRAQTTADTGMQPTAVSRNAPLLAACTQQAVSGSTATPEQPWRLAAAWSLPVTTETVWREQGEQGEQGGGKYASSVEPAPPGYLVVAAREGDPADVKLCVMQEWEGGRYTFREGGEARLESDSGASLAVPSFQMFHGHQQVIVGSSSADGRVQVVDTNRVHETSRQGAYFAAAVRGRARASEPTYRDPQTAASDLAVQQLGADGAVHEVRTAWTGENLAQVAPK